MLRVIGALSLACALALPLMGQADPTSGAAAPKEAAPADQGGNHGAHHGANHGGNQTGEATFAAADTASSEAYRAANAKMHAGMEITYTGDADVDFLRGMIAHHQGAVDMAQVVLQHGLDPEVKALAETIIATQEEEIVKMKSLLAQRGF